MSSLTPVRILADHDLVACETSSEQDSIVPSARLGELTRSETADPADSVRDLCIQCEGVATDSDGSGHSADHIMMKVCPDLALLSPSIG